MPGRSSAGSNSPGRASRCSIRATGGARSGRVANAQPDAVEEALARAVRAAPSWNRTPADSRAAVLERAADLYERDRALLMALIIREGGRTIPAALSEVREAADFLRYYAARARADFARPEPLPGPTGERNEIALHGRGVFACISPWNFPLAIFTGQIAAALAAGNAVIAKPAEQTPLVAAAAVRLMLAAGIPGDVLHLLPGPGESIGGALVADPRIAGHRLHRLDRNRARHQPRARPAPRADRAADRRNRRAERDDRRFVGARRAGRRRCPGFGLRQRRPALLVPAPALSPGRHRRAGPGDAGGRDGRAPDRRSGAARDRYRPGHRRRGAPGPGAARRADGSRGPASSTNAGCRPPRSTAAPGTAASSRRAPSRSIRRAGSSARCSGRSCM